MRAITVERPGGPEVLAVTDAETPTPGPTQVLVDVAAAGVNYMDIYQREGIYAVPTPFVLGVEGAGTVTAVGADVTDLAPGDRVGWVSAQGSYADQVLVEAAKAVPLPDAVSESQAAAVLLQGITAHYLAVDTYPVQQGDTVVVHAAAGGVGQLLTQIVKRRGGRVLATVSTPAKEELARAAGADEVFGYDGFEQRARELTGGEGVAAVYDGVGRSTFDAGLTSLRPRGVFVLYGAASGPVPPVDPQRLNAAGSVYLTRPSIAHYTRTREELLARAGDVLGWLADGSLVLRGGEQLPLTDARAAHEALASRRTTGKLVLVP